MVNHQVVRGFVMVYIMAMASGIRPCLAAGGRKGGGRGNNNDNNDARITVMGFVYCDICSTNSFSNRSYSLPGTEVKIDCKFRANFPRTREQISFTVNRTTNRHGIYRLEIPSVDGIQCREAASNIASACQATLISTSSSSCNVPSSKTTTDHVTFKLRKDNVCFYSFDDLSFRPSQTDVALCGFGH